MLERGSSKSVGSVHLSFHVEFVVKQHMSEQCACVCVRVWFILYIWYIGADVPSSTPRLVAPTKHRRPFSACCKLQLIPLVYLNAFECVGIPVCLNDTVHTTQKDRVLQRRDLIAAAELIKSARAEFLSAEDNDGTAEVDATLVKIKADMVVEAMDIARKVCLG